MAANDKRYSVRVRGDGKWWSYNVGATSHGHAVDRTLKVMGWGNCLVTTVVKQCDLIPIGVR